MILDLGGDGEDALPTDPGVALHLGVDGWSVTLSVITYNSNKSFHCTSSALECKSFHTQRTTVNKTTKSFKAGHCKQIKSLF